MSFENSDNNPPQELPEKKEEKEKRTSI